MVTSIIRNSDIVQVIRGAKIVDEYNSDFVDWSNPQIVASGRASVQHFLTTEDDSGRQTTTEGLRLISDDPALFGVIEPTDRIAYAGRIYEADAQPQDWRLFSRNHHIEIYLRRVVG